MRHDQLEGKPGKAHALDRFDIKATALGRESSQNEGTCAISRHAVLMEWCAFVEETNHVLHSMECLHEAIALAVVDVDHFRYVNSAHGREIGDELLQLMGQQLVASLPAKARLAKLSGDEFAILFRGHDDELSLFSSIEYLLRAARRPIKSGITLSVSVGLARRPVEGSGLSELLEHAEAALTEAKGAGRNTWRLANSAHCVSMKNRLRLENDLRLAIGTNLLRMHYQPLVQLATGKVAGAEGLVRWSDPDGHLVPPAIFIPIAEESGLIESLGKWVLGEACRQAQQWIREGKLVTSVSVNVSALQLYRGVLERHVTQALCESGLPADRLELELTESVLLRDIDFASSAIKHLRNRGVKVSIDDFGTGYANFSYLSKLRVDTIKIDKSFVQQMLGCSDSARIVTSIANLARSLGLATIAEGVEDAAIARLLEAVRCDFGQGYYYGLPVPPAQFASTFDEPRDQVKQGLKSTLKGAIRSSRIG